MAERVAPAGDVDGDGRQDALVIEGEDVRVLLADRPGTPGLRGFKITGASIDDDLPVGVGPAGDVNGDGLGDLVVASQFGDDDAAAFVVLGRSRPRDVDLGHPEERDVTLIGPVDAPVAAAGDVNGDGVDDIVVGAPEYGLSDDEPAEDDGVDEEPSSVTVIFGTPALRGRVLVRRPPAGALRLTSRDRNADLSTNVSAAGDVDGDGRDDVVVGVPFSDRNDDLEQLLSAPGAAFIAYGRAGGGTVSLEEPGVATRVAGRNGSLLGFTSAPAGDVNGDGLADVAIGAPISGIGANGPLATPDGPPPLGGEVAIVYGQRDRPRNVDTDALGDGGLMILGDRVLGGAGLALAGAGDVDADGFADVVVGAPGVEFEEDELRTGDGGSVHVVYGAPGGGVVRLAGAGDRALTLRGSGAEQAGLTVAAGTDLDADGQRELLVARSGACRVGRLSEGDVALVEPGTPAPERLPGRGTADVDRLTGSEAGDQLWGFGGADVLWGRGGHECVMGGEGNDAIAGGSDGDVLFGENGDDAIDGASGPDKVSGGSGADAIVAGPDAQPRQARERDGDNAAGNAGDDELSGGIDDDRLSGGRDDDSVNGGAGRDTLDGDSGDDVLFGGAGNDSIGGGTGADRLSGAAGDDLLDGDAVFGTDDDLVAFLDAPDRRGPDVLDGGSGDDRLYGSRGADRLSGGTGRDQIDARDRSRDVVRCGRGRDVAHVDRRDRVFGCERVVRRR